MEQKKNNQQAKAGNQNNESKIIVTIILAVIAAIAFFQCIGSNDFDTVSTNLTVFMLSVIGALINTGVWDTTYSVPGESEEEEEESNDSETV